MFYFTSKLYCLYTYFNETELLRLSKYKVSFKALMKIYI